MRVLVTGAAGFIGSHTCDRLLGQGHDVVGVDCFTDHYARELKERNLIAARERSTFSLLEIDLARDDLVGLLDGIDTVVHLAAQAGVRRTGGEGFETYVARNVVATQRLLEEAAASAIKRFVHASSSSVYGDAAQEPTSEGCPLAPISLYGMTKLAAEELAGVYMRSHGVPVTTLRFFTVYGPRQRPDMAFHRFIAAALEGERIQLIGDGRQTRDFTYVGDAVDATILAATRSRVGAVYNVGGGKPRELNEAVALIGELVERPLDFERRPALVGEAKRTSCDGSLAQHELGFVPRTPLATGLSEQLLHMVRERELSARAARTTR